MWRPSRLCAGSCATRGTTPSCATKPPRRWEPSGATKRERPCAATPRTRRPKSRKRVGSRLHWTAGAPTAVLTTATTRTAPSTRRRRLTQRTSRASKTRYCARTRSGISTAPCSPCATSGRARPSRCWRRPWRCRGPSCAATSSATNSPSSWASSPTTPPNPPSRPSFAIARCTPWSATKPPRPSARSVLMKSPPFSERSWRKRTPSSPSPARSPSTPWRTTGEEEKSATGLSSSSERLRSSTVVVYV
mmetsp:Transcript_26373/g.81142  ORF Transcript_26373/g.81142 Transcript_26373/m.81142 type:complete len:248 (+) Transcript_26373:248-991(+)